MSLLHGLLATIFPPMPEPIAELRPGYTATVRGRVVARDLMESPLTGDRCVYYHYTVEQWRRSGVVGAGDGFWHVADRDEAILEFYIQDRDGDDRAIVAPHRARVERGRGVRVGDVDLGGIMDRRAQQLLIRPGDEIEVTGTVDEVHDLFDEDRAYRISPARYMLRAPTDGEIAIRLLPRSADDI
jgi:hypothetical protein